jgi:hypothetical protein
MYTITFAQDIFKTNHSASGAVPSVAMTGNGLTRLYDINRTKDDFQLCFEPGNTAVDCGKGWHCSDTAELSRAECEASDTNSSWQTTLGSCGTYAAALESGLANIGTNASRSSNDQAWRKGVSVALCAKNVTKTRLATINGVAGQEVRTFAQVGADQTFYVEQNECHLTDPDHGTTTGGDVTCGTELPIGETCQYACDTGYSLDRDTTCDDDKRLRAGTCTLIDGDGGKDQTRPDGYSDDDAGPRANGETYEKYDADTRGTSDHLEDMHEETQYSSTGSEGAYDSTLVDASATVSDKSDGAVILEDVAQCRFLPPNRIFPDALIQGQEVNNNGSTWNEDKSMGGENEDHSSTDNSFFGDDTDTDYKNNIAKIRMRFNVGALTTDARNSYNYYLIFMTKGSISDNLADNKAEALQHDDQMAIMSIDASGESSNNGEFFQMDHEQVSANPNDCYYDDANDATVQHCRPTAQIEFWKRYQVVIGAASKCAGSHWADKEHVFIRATYTVDSEFTLKYAPGLNLDNSGFKELQPGIWVRNRLSSDQPTLMMHSDYSKSIVNVAKASQTVTHASLHAFTRLELLDPLTGGDSVDGDSARTQDQPDDNLVTGAQQDNAYNNGHTETADAAGAGDTAVGDGMCRDAHVEATHVSGFNTDTGDDSDSDVIVNQARGCLFRARMTVQQFEDDNNLNAINATETMGHYRDRTDPGSITYHEAMVSTLSGYQLELAMSQYAQFNMRVLAQGGLQKLADEAQRPYDFGLRAATPAIAAQNDPASPAFGADVRFDICGCHVEHEQADAPTTTMSTNDELGVIADNNDSISPYGFKRRNQCSYNGALHTFLKDNRDDQRGLADYTDSNEAERVGFIVTRTKRSDPTTTNVPGNITTASTPVPALAQGLTYVKQFDNPEGTDMHSRGIGAACTYEAFFPPHINTPFAYVRAWFKFKEASHVDQVNPELTEEGTDGDINTNPTQWAPGGQLDNDNGVQHDNGVNSTHGYSGHDAPGGAGEPNNGLNQNDDPANDAVATDEQAPPSRRLRGEDIRRLAEDATQKAPPVVQHSVHFKFA